MEDFMDNDIAYLLMTASGQLMLGITLTLKNRILINKAFFVLAALALLQAGICVHNGLYADNHEKGKNFRFFSIAKVSQE